MSMTEKQAAFVESYLIDFNGKRAAIAAGYSSATAEQAASRLLRHVEVAAEIERRRNLLQIRSGVTTEMVIAELAKLGFSDIKQVVEWRNITATAFDEHGEPMEVPEVGVSIRDSDEIDEKVSAAISEVSRSKDGTIKIKMHDKLGALVKIGQHLGMFRQQAAPEEPGKKDQAEDASRSAHKGTAWDGLLQ